LLGCPAGTTVTVPTELSAVTHMSLFLDCHECFLVAGFGVKLTAKILFLLIEYIEFLGNKKGTPV